MSGWLDAFSLDLCAFSLLNVRHVSCRIAVYSMPDVGPLKRLPGEHAKCHCAQDRSFENGFTLMEILVAISVLAIALVVILQLFSGGLKSGRISDAYTLGVFHAEEKMDEILLSESLIPGITEGEFEDGYRWRATIEQVVQTEEEASKLPLDMFQIRVAVSWDHDMAGEGKHVELSTLKVIEKTKEE
jgi:general secretion pathway protein I